MLSTDEGKFIKKKVDEHPVMVFSKTTCTYCKMALKTLNDTDVSYEIEEIDKREDVSKLQDIFLKLTGERTVSGCHNFLFFQISHQNESVMVTLAMYAVSRNWLLYPLASLS